MTNTFTQVFGGTTIYPSDVSYLALPLNANTTLEWPLEASEGPNVVARIIDVTPTGAYTITMPDASKAGVGETVLFNNLGPNTISVNTATGGGILSIAAGEQWQIYLTDNSTTAGTWRTFRYGAATAQAQASALAGAGLKAAGSALEQNLEVIPFSSTPTTITTADRAKVFVWTGALGTMTLPPAPSVDDGWFISVRNNGSGDLTVDPSGSETINGGSTLVFQPGDSAEIITDGVSWYTVGFGQSVEFAFDYTSIVITGGTYTLAGSELNRIAYKFSGTLASNAEIVVPATIQQYWINNSTTGAYTLSIKVSGSAFPVVIPQNETSIYYSDGTNIVQAQTTTAFGGVLSILQGGTGSTTAPGALTNLGGTGIGTSVFTAATTADARTAIVAAKSGANSDITSLTGLTTPLSVAQGGTGANTLPSGVVLAGNGTGAISSTNMYYTGFSLGIGGGTATPVTEFSVRNGDISVEMNTPTTVPWAFSGYKSRGSIGAKAAVANGDGLLRVRSYGHDGTNYYTRGEILFNVDGAVSTGVVPTRIIFYTGSSSSIERMRIDAAGNVGIGTGANASEKLQVSLGNIRLTDSYYLGWGGTANYITGSNATNTVSIFTNGSSQLSIASTGGVTSANIPDAVGYKGIPKSLTSVTAALVDVGKCIAITGNIDIPNSTFAAGDTVSIYNAGSGSLSITQGSGLTLRLAGTALTGTRTIARYGMATVWFNSSSEAIVSGAGVT